jgi:hypothetical protein
MSTTSGRAGNKKVVIGVAAAAGVLALLGLIRAATSSGSAEPAQLSASAGASVAPPSPPAEAPQPAGTAPPSAAPESPELPEPAPAKAPEPPTSAPALSPAGVRQVAPNRQQPQQPQQPAPLKKKPYRPSGI